MNPHEVSPEIIKVHNNTGAIKSKVLRKLVFICNNLAIYHSIPFNEVIIRLKIDHNQYSDFIWYKPHVIPIENEMKYLHILHLALVDYIETGLINRREMEIANEAWQFLKMEAAVAKLK